MKVSDVKYIYEVGYCEDEELENEYVKKDEILNYNYFIDMDVNDCDVNEIKKIISDVNEKVSFKKFDKIVKYMEDNSNEDWNIGCVSIECDCSLVIVSDIVYEEEFEDVIEDIIKK